MKAITIIVAALIVAWCFRYENIPCPRSGECHRNRITGATCVQWEECWFGDFWSQR